MVKKTPARSVPYTIEFKQNGIFYFTVTKELTIREGGKEVLVGTFSGERNSCAPDTLTLDQEYCMKVADIRFPLERFHKPQSRYFWDFIPFQGDHLRTILTMNDDTAAMIQKIESNQLDPYTNAASSEMFHCMTVEPYYLPFDPQFTALRQSLKDNGTAPQTIERTIAINKLDALLQIVKGLEQLLASPLYSGARITAHRDMKFANVVVDPAYDTLHLRIIDFPSIKYLRNTAAPVADATTEGALSLANTAPEDVIPDLEVSTATDVYALGMMLGEMFGGWCYKNTYRNPLHIALMHAAKSLDINDAQACAKFFRKQIQRFCGENGRCVTNEFTTNWLEELLNAVDLYASWPQNVGIDSMFRRSTELLPQNRITLDKFRDRLLKIRQLFVAGEGVSGPHLAFLVDHTDLETNLPLFLKAAEKILINHPTATVDVYGYRQGFLTMLQPSSAVLRDIDTDPTTDLLALKSLLKTIVDADKRAGVNTAPLAGAKSYLIGCLYEVICKHQSQAAHTAIVPEIHIFCPTPPTALNTTPFLVSTDIGGVQNIGQFDGGGVLELLNAKKAYTIFVHCPTSPSTDHAENWYFLNVLTDDAPPSSGAAPMTGTEVHSALDITDTDDDSPIEII